MPEQVPESAAASEAQLFAHRRLSPFRGTLQVIAIAGARALSADGINWELQVASRPPDTLWGQVQPPAGARQFFRFGVWSEADGLAKVPVNPIMDIGEMLAAAERLLEAVEAHWRSVPLPLTDRFEYWLLDSNHRPIALLASSPTADHLQLNPPDFHACLPAERFFRQHTQPGCGPDHSPARQLEQLIKRESGSNRSAQWIERHPDGSGLGLSGRISAQLKGRRLPAEAFPELLLQHHWPAPADQALVDEYLCWLAPMLLTLPSLAEKLRDELQQQALLRPQLVDRLHALYPPQTDPSWLKQARVAARVASASG